MWEKHYKKKEKKKKKGETARQIFVEKTVRHSYLDTDTCNSVKFFCKFSAVTLFLRGHDKRVENIYSFLND